MSPSGMPVPCWLTRNALFLSRAPAIQETQDWDVTPLRGDAALAGGKCLFISRQPGFGPVVRSIQVIWFSYGLGLNVWNG